MEPSEDAEMVEQTMTRTVTKRDGNKQEFDKKKILNRLVSISHELNEEYVKFEEVVEKVWNGVYEGKEIIYNYLI